jgi:hypothetical protein
VDDQRYTTKVRAKRIELSYFKHAHPFRRWKLMLSIAAPVIAGGWLVGYAAFGDSRLYTSGPVSAAHTMFGATCAECHRPADADGQRPDHRGFFLRVTDGACTTCHRGPTHHDSQAFSPACTTCHVEHKGHVALAALDDMHCTQCHRDLKTGSGAASRFEASITRFAGGHPEFAVQVGDRRVRLDRAGEVKDTANVLLNHQKHLRVGLKGLDQLRQLRGSRGIVQAPNGLQLSCGFCHETNASRATIQPVSYARHCGPACHELDFDGRFPDVVAPHDSPGIVHGFLRTLFLETFEACQSPDIATPPSPQADTRRAQCGELGLSARTEAPPTGAPVASPPESEQPRGGRLLRRSAPETKEEPPADQPRGRRLLRGGAAQEAPAERDAGRAQRETPGRSALAWVSAELPGAENLLFKQRCQLCHVKNDDAKGPLPQYLPTRVPVRWLPHSVFDHGVHRPIQCVECHKANTSSQTADVLLPSVSVCRECHRAGSGARTACVECHLYHDKSLETDLDGRHPIRRLTGRAPS